MEDMTPGKLDIELAKNRQKQVLKSFATIASTESRCNSEKPYSG